MKYLLFAMLPILFIMPYGKFRCTHKKYKDPLETPLLWSLDGWSGTHFFWFMVIGYVYPETLILSTILGISWELFEHYYGTARPGWLGGYGDCDSLGTDYDWYGYGKNSDIVCNTAGFLIGQYLHGL